jgi:predicted phosphoribosyltransferase
MLHIATGVVDVAHEVAARAFTSGDLDTARLAAKVGRMADPADERAWRDAIRTEWALGRAEAVERLVDQLIARVEARDQELDPETEDLIREIDEHHTSKNGGQPRPSARQLQAVLEHSTAA